MSDLHSSIALLERARMFQEQLMDISTLDSLINLSATVLDCSLYICDGQGFILANSPIEARACPVFCDTVANTRQITKEKLKTLLGPTPLCNVLRDPLCRGDTCSRLSFPLKIGKQQLPGAVTFFIWDRPLTPDDQALAAMIAGTFSVFMRKHAFMPGALQASKLSLLRELLDYKPGLRSYYERSLSMENMPLRQDGYRLLCIAADPSSRIDADTLSMEIQCQLPEVWVLPYNERILLIFNEARICTDDLFGAQSGFLERQHLQACLSLEFSSLLDLRYVYEDTQFCLSLAARMAPQTRLHRAEQYMDLVFLSKCREYFPIERYYLAGFERLCREDRETGKNYLEVLAAYLCNNMSVSAASKAIFMHRNTMSQQLEKIEEILGVSLHDPGVCWYLQLCLKIHALLCL